MERMVLYELTKLIPPGKDFYDMIAEDGDFIATFLRRTMLDGGEVLKAVIEAEGCPLFDRFFQSKYLLVFREKVLPGENDHCLALGVLSGEYHLQKLSTPSQFSKTVFTAQELAELALQIDLGFYSIAVEELKDDKEVAKADS